MVSLNKQHSSLPCVLLLAATILACATSLLSCSSAASAKQPASPEIPQADSPSDSSQESSVYDFSHLSIKGQPAVEWSTFKDAVISSLNSILKSSVYYFSHLSVKDQHLVEWSPFEGTVISSSNSCLKSSFYDFSHFSVKDQHLVFCYEADPGFGSHDEEPVRSCHAISLDTDEYFSLDVPKIPALYEPQSRSAQGRLRYDQDRNNSVTCCTDPAHCQEIDSLQDKTDDILQFINLKEKSIILQKTDEGSRLTVYDSSCQAIQQKNLEYEYDDQTKLEIEATQDPKTLIIQSTRSFVILSAGDLNTLYQEKASPDQFFYDFIRPSGVEKIFWLAGDGDRIMLKRYEPGQQKPAHYPKPLCRSKGGEYTEEMLSFKRGHCSPLSFNQPRLSLFSGELILAQGFELDGSSDEWIIDTRRGQLLAPLGGDNDHGTFLNYGSMGVLLDKQTLALILAGARLVLIQDLETGAILKTYNISEELSQKVRYWHDDDYPYYDDDVGIQRYNHLFELPDKKIGVFMLGEKNFGDVIVLDPSMGFKISKILTAPQCK